MRFFTPMALCALMALAGCRQIAGYGTASPADAAVPDMPADAAVPDSTTDGSRPDLSIDTLPPIPCPLCAY